MRAAGVTALLVAATGLACSAGPMVAPLRYGPVVPTPDEAFRATPPESTLVAPVAALPWRVTRLPNGLRVAHIERHGLPFVAIRLILERGAADAGAPEDTYGIFEGLLGAGTAERTRAELSRAYVDLGAGHGLGCTPDACVLAVTAPAESLDGALSLVAETAIRPRLLAPELADEKKRWLQGFKEQSAFHRNVLILLFGASDYGFSRPSAEHTEGLGVPDLAALHARLFQPAQATLVIVGDATPAAVEASAERWFADWTAHAVPLSRATITLPKVGGVHLAHLSRVDFAHTRVLVTARTPAPGESDYAAAAVLTSALGGLSSPLHEGVRDERGAAYSIDAVMHRLRAVSYVAVGGTLDRDKATPALRAIVQAIRDLRTRDLGEEELSRARARLLAGWRTGVSTNDGLAVLAGTVIGCGSSLDAIATFPARVQAVTAEEVRRAAQRYLADDALRIVVMGDGISRRELAGLGLGDAEHRDEYGRATAH